MNTDSTAAETPALATAANGTPRSTDSPPTVSATTPSASSASASTARTTSSLTSNKNSSAAPKGANHLAAVNVYTGNMRSNKNSRPAPTEIEFKHMKFLITDRPTDSTMASYVQELERHAVKNVVRVCEPTYEVSQLRAAGIDVHDLVFDDGTAPPNEVVEVWLQLLKKRNSEQPGSTVAVHCVAGLGRAPVLVAIALMELGLKYEDAVERIREKRRGAINAKQLNYLEKYRPKARLRIKRDGKFVPSCCMQ